MFERDDEGRIIREILPLEGARKLIAERMTTSINVYPQGSAIVTLDIGNVIKFREEMKAKDIKLSIGDIFVKAVGCALEKVPEMNGSRGEDELRYYRSANIGMMVSVDGNLLVVVAENVQAKTVEQVSQELSKSYEYLRKGKLMRVKMDGATFSISNLGMYPIDGFTPLLNPPEGGILGIGRSRRVPSYDENGNIVPRDEISISVTTDHGFVDGISVVKFIAAVKEALDNPWTSMYEVTQLKEDEQ